MVRFISTEIEAFFTRNGIKHLMSAPYHPASNGLAERAVQIVKKGLRKITHGSMRTRLAQVLLTYRLTPQSTTGISPSELLLGRRPRSRLDLLKPNTAERVERNQRKQKEQHDLRSRERNFGVGDDVFVRNYHHGDKWLPGVIQQKTGPVSYRVRLATGKDRRCHQDQVRKHLVEFPRVSDRDSDIPDIDLPSSEVIVPSTTNTEPSTSSSTPETTTTESSTNAEPASPDLVSTNTDVAVVNPTTTEKSYPKRNRAPVVRFEPTWT